METETVAQSRRDLENRIKGLKQSLEDIQINVRVSRQRFETILESITEGILLADPVTHRLYHANQAIRTMIGYASDEIESLNVMDIHPADEFENVVDLIESITKTGAEEIAELTVKRKDGSFFPAKIKSKPITLDNHLYIIEIIRDMTEEKNATDHIRYLTDLLIVIRDINRLMTGETEPDRLLNGVCKSLIHHRDIQNAWIIVYDEKGHYEKSAQAGLDDDLFSALIEQTRMEKTPYCVQQSLSHPGIHVMEDSTAFCTNCPMEKECLSKMRISVRLDHKWRIYGSLVISGGNDIIIQKEDRILIQELADDVAYSLYNIDLEDISRKVEDLLRQERMALETKVEERTAELSVANAELVRANRLKDEFLASVSHELRTPLISILGLSEALQDQVYGDITPKQASISKKIELSGQKLLSLINNLLDISRIQINQLEIETSSARIREICEESLAAIEKNAAEKSITLKSSYCLTVETIETDRQRLKQVLVHLLENAAKFSPENSEIFLKVHDEANVVHFIVTDEGIGIDEGDFKYLFNPFMQINGTLSRKYGGVGIGLALARKMTELLGGGITVNSEIGKGSRFMVSLPTKFQQVGHTTQESALKTDGAHTLMNRENIVSVLLAEDNEENILTVKDYLEVKGFEVIVARNGLEALDQTKSKYPDIILMDIQMPDMDGLEAIRRIRIDLGVKDTPIIALTALAMPGDREKCLAAGADEYLSKPVLLKELVRKIHSYIRLEA